MSDSDWLDSNLGPPCFGGTDEKLRYGQARSVVMDEKSGPVKKVLLADGPRMLCEFNPKGATYFADRVCETCDGPIMTHWLIPSSDVEKRTAYWCNPEGTQESTGMKV